MAEGTCSWEDCERTVRARGFCALHYYAWQRSGKPWPEPSPRNCEHCGATFVPIPAFKKYCSDRCNGNAWAAREAAKRPPKAERVCHHCGCSYRPRAHNQIHCSSECVAAARRSENRRIQWPDRVCLRCGNSFAPSHWRAKYCSEKCRQRTRDRQRAHRWRIKRTAIFERDGWTCQICHEPVDGSLCYPHHHAATIDHIVPVSRGGTDDPANLQTAHMVCNSSKGDSEWV